MLWKWKRNSSGKVHFKAGGFQSVFWYTVSLFLYIQTDSVSLRNLKGHDPFILVLCGIIAFLHNYVVTFWFTDQSFDRLRKQR